MYVHYIKNLEACASCGLTMHHGPDKTSCCKHLTLVWSDLSFVGDPKTGCFINSLSTILRCVLRWKSFLKLSLFQIVHLFDQLNTNSCKAGNCIWYTLLSYKSAFNPNILSVLPHIVLHLHWAQQFNIIQCTNHSYISVVQMTLILSAHSPTWMLEKLEKISTC